MSVNGLIPPFLVACSGDSGDSGALVWLTVMAGLAAWVLVTALIVRTAGDWTERRLLLGLLVGSIVIGPLITAAYYQGLFGSDNSIGKVVVLLTIPGLIAAVIAHLTHSANRLRAFFIGVWGAVFPIGAGFFLFFVAVVVGGACLE